MIGVSSGSAPPLSWASAGRPVRGGEVSGDTAVVVPVGQGVLAAVIDGLGHGPRAAEPAALAAARLQADPGQPVDRLVVSCHEALRRSRGAVMSVARVDVGAQRVTWSGIGNVSGVIVRRGAARRHLLAQGGVLGDRLPRVRVGTEAFARGDLLLLASDGLSASFLVAVVADRDLERIVSDVLSAHALDTDDATILAVRWDP